MSAIFISHSSKDNNAATELRDLLEKQGYRSIFLDFNPEQGIPAGRDWEQELYAQLRASQAVIVLCSSASMQSNWCFAEITHAKALGKQLFPMKVGDCVINTVLTSRQVLDMTHQSAEEVFKQLWDGLKKAGLDPTSSFDWDGKRPPYPGLMAFEEKDAAVFFGREPEIQKGLELLTQMNRYRGARMMVVLGSSGSGKSSLVKAGIVPRLRRDEDSWQLVPPFRPGTDPLRELSVSLAEALQRNGAAASADGIHDLLKHREPALAAEALVRKADEFRIAAGHRAATVVLVVDQLEELLTYGSGAGAQQLLPVLEAALNAPQSPLMVIATLRSDFLGDLQLQRAARTLAFENLQLGPMPKERLFKVIEGPAEMAGLRLEQGLTQTMIEDTETNDALPLLAFTLRELYEKFGDDKLLKLDEYRERLGGLSGAVATAAEAVYRAKPLSPEQQADLRRAFRMLARVDEDGKYVRQPASRSELPPSVGDVLERFVQARLLVARGEGTKQIIEVAHEALFRSWERLRLWLDEDREVLLWQQRLHSAADEWERTSRDSGALLRGANLAEAERHFENNPGDLQALDRKYIEESLEQRQREELEKEQARTERERVQKRNNRVLAGFLAVAIVLTAGAGWQWHSATAAKQQTIREVVAASWKTGSFLNPNGTTAAATQGLDSISYLAGTRRSYSMLKLIMNLPKLGSLSGLSVFASGPHTTDFNFRSNRFGYYNPEFVVWAGDHLIPAADDSALRRVTQGVYDTHLSEMARFYYLAYQDLHADQSCMAELKATYQDSLSFYSDRPHEDGFLTGPGRFIGLATNAYLNRVDSAEKERTGNDSSLAGYYAGVAAGFWIRRDIDGTSDEFLTVFRKLLNTYDAKWFKDHEKGGTGTKVCE